MSRIVEKIRFALSDPFAGIASFPSLSVVNDSRPPPNCRYVIFFTPRSGSSRLTDVLTLAKGLGHPDECFNPEIISSIASELRVSNLEEYVSSLVRHRSDHDVFGCEITYLQLLLVFRRTKRFITLLKPTSFLWLIREDIIAQAVSISRMVQTGVSQSVLSSECEIATAEIRFTFDASAIRWALIRLLWLERQTERVFDSLSIEPLRLSYELVNEYEASKIVSLITSHIGATPFEKENLVTRYRKISGEKSVDFAARFERKHPRFVQWINETRRSRISALKNSRTMLEQK